MFDTALASERLAIEHGVDAASVSPPSKASRLKLFAEILQRQDVPYPIDEQVAHACYEAAESGIPFAIGTLSDSTVDLEGFDHQQIYEDLTLEDHLSWAFLVADQQTTKHKYACREYLFGEQMFEIGGQTIPDYYILNARIYQQTQWQLATVTEIIPANVFFHCHGQKFFPVTTFMRPFGTDYLEEPDIGHDIAGHVATFTIPEVAQVMNNHGIANDIINREKEQLLASVSSEEEAQRICDFAAELLLYAGRLYWFTVEFGLVMQSDGLKAFGAGILSSPGETRYSVDSPNSNRILIDPTNDRDLLRLATTDYLISEFQKTYFVLKDFKSLSSLTPERIVSTVKIAARLPHHTWREMVPGDEVIHVGIDMTSPNEKYMRLLAGHPIDECLSRTAIRNLRMHTAGFATLTQVEENFINNLPPVPDEMIEDFASLDIEALWDEGEENEGNSGEPELDLRSFLQHLEYLEQPICLSTLQELLRRLELSEQDIERIARFEPENYQRNLICRTEGFEVLLLCFEAGQRTPIHDHAGSACGVKVIEGTATETIFDRSEDGWLFATESDELTAAGVVGSFDMDIHQLSNLQPGGGRLTTLHVYSPPLGEVGNYSITNNSVVRTKAATRQSERNDVSDRIWEI